MILISYNLNSFIIIMDTGPQEKISLQKTTGEQLIKACQSLDFPLIKQLVQKGADVNFVHYTDSNCWYRGNSHTPLYVAVHCNFKQDEENYMNVLDYLLSKGANAKFKVTRGGWNHSTQYPLFHGVSHIISKFKEQENQIKFLKLFSKYGVDVNQSERHGRSKNWSAYRNNSCFIFQIMDSTGLRSKIRELQKLFLEVDTHQIERQKKKELQDAFNQQYPLDFQQQVRQQYIPNQQNQGKQNEPRVNLVKAMIQLGANVNSSRSSSNWSNHEYDSFGDDSYEDFKLYQYRNSERENVLHRAIMNNQVDLVKYLIEKGADTKDKCSITIQKPVFPSQWPKKFLEKRKKQNLDNLKQFERTKEKTQEQLSKATNQNEILKLKSKLRRQQFNIFCCLRFTIENEPPRPTYVDIQLSCMEIAQKMKVKAEILDMLKQKQ